MSLSRTAASQLVARSIIEAGGELTVVLPVPPQNLHPNGRAPWIAKARDRKQFRQLAGDSAAYQVLERYGYRPRFERTVLTLAYTFAWPRNGQRQPHDPDNLIAWAKAAIDALQDAGILASDRHVLYAPPRQGWRERGEVQPPSLEVIIQKWIGDRCPLCQHPPTPPSEPEEPSA